MQTPLRCVPFFMLFLFCFLPCQTAMQGAVGKLPKTYDLLEKGVMSCQEGKFEEGIRYFNSVLSMDTNNYFGYINRGIAYKNQQEYEKASEDLIKCMALDPKHPEAYFQMGSLFSNQGNYNDAIIYYSKAINADPSTIKAYGARAIINSMVGNLTDAVNDVNAAITIAPEFPMLYIIRGQILDMKGDCQAALSDFEKAMRFDTENFNTHADIAWILATCPDKKYRNGAKAYQLVTKELESNESHENLKILAAAYAEMGDFKTAALYQEKAIEILKQVIPIHKSEEINIQKNLKTYQDQLKSYQNQQPWHSRHLSHPKP